MKRTEQFAQYFTFILNGKNFKYRNSALLRNFLIGHQRIRYRDALKKENYEGFRIFKLTPTPSEKIRESSLGSINLRALPLSFSSQNSSKIEEMFAKGLLIHDLKF